MRIPKSWVPHIAKRITENITAKDFVQPKVPPDKFIPLVEEIVLEELSIEDRLNDEVRQILKKYESEIERGRMDYRKLFEMTKQKLVRERNLVL
jgi:hypothetical protein